MKVHQKATTSHVDTPHTTIGQRVSTNYIPNSAMLNILSAERHENQSNISALEQSFAERLNTRSFTDNERGVASPLSQRESEAWQGSRALFMPRDVRNQMEHSLGHDFSRVKFVESQSAAQMGEIAYTQGDKAVFAPGTFAPHTAQGKTIIAHELTHVVQQAHGRARSNADAPVNDNPVLEREANVAAESALSGVWDTGSAVAPLIPAQESSAPMQGFLGLGSLKSWWRERQEKKEAKKLARIQQADATRTSAQNLANTITGRADSDFSGMNPKAMLKNMQSIQSVQNDFAGLNISSISGVNMSGANADADMSGRIRFNKAGVYNESTGQKERAAGSVGNYGFKIANSNYTGAHETGHVVNAELIKKLYASSESGDDWKHNLTAEQIMREAAERSMSDDKFRKSLEKRASLKGIAKADRHSGNKAYMDKMKEAMTVKNMRKMGYTSGYGASDAGELYAESFKDYYRTKMKNEKYARAGKTKRLGYNPLSKAMVDISKELYTATPDEMDTFRNKHSVWRNARKTELHI